MDNFSLVFFTVVSNISFGLLVLAAGLGFYKYKLLPKALQWYVGYLGFILIIEVSTKVLSIFNIQNLFLYPYYLAGEFFLLSVVFIETFNISRKAILLAGVLSLLLFWFTNQSLTATNITSGNFKIFSHLAIVCMSGYYMIKILGKFGKDQQDYFLPIYAGLFLYYSISLILFLLLDQLTGLSRQTASLLWSMNNIFSAILYGVSIYALWKPQRP